MKRSSTIAIAKMVQQIVAEHYEEGNHAKCITNIWRKHIKQQFGISKSTLWRYLKVKID